MKLYISQSHDPYYNLALEEYLFRYTEDEVFMLWQNDDTVVVGKNQNVYTELNLSAMNERGTRLARRITGGGAVYHDLGNINYSFISAAANEDTSSFEYFSRPVISALKALGLEVYLSGRNDILLDGKKISGSAEHTEKGRTLHHGTLLFDTDLSVLSGLLTVDREKLTSKGISSVSSRVTNIKPYLGDYPDAPALILALEKKISEQFDCARFSLPEDVRIDELCKRNSSEEWLYPKRRILEEYEERFSKRFPFGRLTVKLFCEGETITDALIEGDFFEGEDFYKLREMLIGERSSLADKIEKLDFSRVITGMTKYDLLSFFELH